MRTRRFRTGGALFVALLPVVGLGVDAAQPVSAYSSSLPSFSTPVVSGVQGQGYEQSLRIDQAGRLYTSVPGSWPSGITWMWRSLDRGKTFKWVPASAPTTGRLPEGTCGGGGDSELAVDPAGNVYLADLTTYNFATVRTSDGGSTFTPPSCLSVATTPDDRPWMATDGNPMSGGSLYLTYDAVVQGTPVCPGGTSTNPDGPNNQLVIARSPAAGQAAGATAGLAFGPAQNIGTGCDEGVMGNVVVSPVTHNVFVVHDDTLYQQIIVGRCTPVDWSVDPTGLQCTDFPVASFPGQLTGANFPTIAVDSAGGLYAVWEEAPCGPCFNSNTTQAAITGDTLLYLSKSTDDGATWTTPVQLPTPGLHNNVYAWIAAGDAGKFDVAWYGTSATEGSGTRGPDSVQGDWGVYLLQSLDGGKTFTPAILASEHQVHRGALNTLLGGQSSANSGGRALGDFLELRIGSDGEANITYGDSNLDSNTVLSQAMFVRQNGGPGVFGNRPVVRGGHKPIDGVTDVACDGTLDAGGLSTPSFPNLDLLSASVTQPDPLHYQVRMQVEDLSSLAPPASDGGPDLVWMTQWHVPSTTDPQGGKVFFAYMESFNGGTPTFWDGESALYLPNGGTGQISYPGAHQITGTYTAGSPATITISVPVADVSDAAVDQNLYSVQASTMTLAAQASSAPSVGGIGGLPFNLIDTTTAFDYVPGLAPSALSPSTTCGAQPPVVSTLTCPDVSPMPVVLTDALGNPLVPTSQLAPWLANGDDCDEIDGVTG